MQALEKDIRPWGQYQVLKDGEFCKVKEITVNPGQRLSYQYHIHRAEVWIVTRGELTIILDDEKIFKKYGETLKIPKGSMHRAWNETDEEVRFIEVQTGTYFGEDDIVRMEDDYDRIPLDMPLPPDDWEAPDETDPEVLAFLEEVDNTPGPWPEEDDKVNTIGGLTMPKENTNKLNKNG